MSSCALALEGLTPQISLADDRPEPHGTDLLTSTATGLFQTDSAE